MSNSQLQLFTLTLVLLTALSPALLSHARASSAAAAQRDHLTEQETDLVRAAQELDRRMEVFVKAIDRRLLVISGTHATSSKSESKQARKDAETWGELPTGTKAELLSDVARIFDEAITNIDDASTRAPQSKLLPKALTKLAEASTRILAQLTPLRATASTTAEREALEQAIENAQTILEAARRTSKT